MYKDILQSAGLTKDQAAIYQVLLKNGVSPASFVIQKTAIKKGQTYKVLDELMKLGLVEKDDKVDQIALFKATHPQNLHALVDEKLDEAMKAERLVDSFLPRLMTDYNLASGRPGILYLEGIEGVEKIANYSLHAKSDILQFVDAETFAEMKYDISKKYDEARLKSRKKKKVLVTGTEQMTTYREHVDTVTEVKYLSYNLLDFKSIMMIFDDIVIYLIIDAEKPTAIMIQNQHIANLQKQFFNFGWATGRQVL